MSFSGTSTATSVHLDAAEALRGAGARVTGEEDEVAPRLALAMASRVWRPFLVPQPRRRPECSPFQGLNFWRP